MLLNVIPDAIFLPLKSVKLGRFVVNVEEPLVEGHHDVPGIEPPQLDPHPFTFSDRKHAGTSTAVSTALTSLISAGFSKRAGTRVQIGLTHGRSYAVGDSDAWFDKATSVDKTKAWLEDQAIRNMKIYMIVGFQTVTDARISPVSHDDGAIKGHVTGPVSLLLAAAGIIVPLAGLIDLHANMKTHHSVGDRSTFVAPGEQICALQYREVKYKWLSSRSVETAQLGKTRR